jgi:hypothetical protein
MRLPSVQAKVNGHGEDDMAATAINITLGPVTV